MIRSFPALVALAVLPAVALAQLPASPYAVPATCPGGVCPRPTAAAAVVRSAVAEVIAPPAPQSSPVYGTWTVPTQPWHVTPPAAVPQQMPARQPVRDAIRRLLAR